MKKEDVKVKKLNNKGFSLVEIIIVIAIMAILAGALAPQLIKYIEKSRKSADVQTAQTIATAANVALADGGGGTGTTTLSKCIKPEGTETRNDFEIKVGEILGDSAKTTKPKSKDYKNFLIIYDTDNGIKIYATKDESATPSPSPSPSAADQLYPVVGANFN